MKKIKDYSDFHIKLIKDMIFQKFNKFQEKKVSKTPKKEIFYDEEKDNENNEDKCHYYNRYNIDIGDKLKNQKK